MATQSKIEIIQVKSGRYTGQYFICRGNKYLGPNGEWSSYIKSDSFYRLTEEEANQDAEKVKRTAKRKARKI